MSGSQEEIEVKCLEVADGGALSTSLPAGMYRAVVSTFGQRAILLEPFNISAGTPTDVGVISF